MNLTSEKSVPILLYSKYSDSCKSLSSLITQELISKINLQLLCIDNEKVRQRIRNSEKLNVSIVPTILVFYPSGFVEKYEGDIAHSYIKEIIRIMTPPPPNVFIKEEPVVVQKPPPPQRKPQEKKKVEKQTPQTIARDIARAREMSERDTRKQNPNIPEENVREVAATSIDDIPMDDDEYEYEEDENNIEEDDDRKKMFDMGDRYLERPTRAKMIKNKGNYEDIEDIYGPQRTDDRHTGNVSTKIKPAPTRGTKSSGDVSSEAARIAKERDQEIQISGPKPRN